MRPSLRATRFLGSVALLAGLGSACESSRDPKNHVLLSDRDDFREEADGKEAIAHATARAGREGKRVLLLFGGDWSKWCHALHALFDADVEVAATLASHYVLVTVDSDRNPEVGQGYGDALKREVPVLVFLDGKGQLLHVQETRSLEQAEGVAYDRARVLAVLKQWAPGAG